MLDRVLGALSTLPFVVGTAVAPSVAAHEVFTFADSAIVESSGLVLTRGLFVTMNDSGDTGRVFAVDRTGRTVGTTYWSEDPIDVESLAPAGPGWVWVGDTGGNTVARDTVQIAKVPVGRFTRTVTPTVYDLTYPDGDHDTETMLTDPNTGRVYLASKGLLGGTLYAAPEQLVAGEPNRLVPVGDVLSVATDGAFFPDGKHLIVRNYGEAAVYAFPSMHQIGVFDLPAQQQGEGLAVARDGSIYLTSEGLHSPVLQISLPRSIARAMRPATSTAAVSDDSAYPEKSILDPFPGWFLPTLIGGVVVMVGLAIGLRRR